MERESSVRNELASTGLMLGLVYLAPGQMKLEKRPRARVIEPSDAVVKMVKTTICGTDLHIMKGDVPSCAPGRILGHEGVGIIESIGSAVSQFKIGDHVLISCITSCGKCDFCRRQMYSHCTTGGWILGNTIDGTQAEFVRIPYADNSLYHAPVGVDEEALVMLSDIIPTGFEKGVLNGKVKPGGTVAIIGAGPIGLGVVLTAQFFSPAKIIVIDMDDNRLETATRLGATDVINNRDGQAVAKVMALTNGLGVDTAIEAVGLAASFETCQSIIGVGGVIANIGVHGEKVDLELNRLWDRNISITTGLVDTESTRMLLSIVKSGKINPSLLVTHHFKLADIVAAYETFGMASKTRALKVIIEA